MSKVAVFLCLVCLGGTLALQRRNDDVSIAALATDVTNLASQVSLLTAELNAAKSQLASLQTVVAFHAWAPNGFVSYAAEATIQFGIVHTNIGQGLNAQTGVFTAPVTGLYEFHASFMASDQTPDYVHAAITVDGQSVALSISDSRHAYYDNTGVHAVIHLTAGQHVWVKNASGKVSTYYGNLYLSFSGFLIHAG